MTPSNQPDEAAFPDTLSAIRLLSQRDLAARIPINYVPVPGASLSAVCFQNDTYTSDILSKCLLNLLVTGFRRINVDLFWDETTQRWSFCPVQLGQPGSSTNSTSTTTTGSSMAISLGTAALTGRAVETTTNTQTTRSNSTHSPSLSSQHIPTTTSSTTAPSSLTTTSVETLASAAPIPSDSPISKGQYTCTASADFAFFMNTLKTYLDDTENNLNATTIYLTMNIHAAGTLTGGTLSATAPSYLPKNEQLLKSILQSDNSAYLYTPSQLGQQRDNVNATGSWFGVPESDQPDTGYLTLMKQNTIYTSESGWPNAGFIQYDDGKRLLAGFGIVDATMAKYNFSADAFTIFSPDYIESDRSYQLSSSSQITSGCVYDPTTATLAASNNSWTVAGIEQGNSQTAEQIATELIQCGISPVLNTTLDGATAAQSIEAYRQVVMSTIWSWNVDEPKDNVNSSQSYHCAALNATSGYWQVESCGAAHFCACRFNNEPYAWQISDSALPYDRVDRACPYDTDFSTSRTALENNYLLKQWRLSRAASSVDDELLFLNFNDLDLATCWVIGQDTPCPYKDTDSTNKLVVVPTVAAVIVFVLTILTVFVKCAANRQSTRQRRRRGNDNMGDYEGVPA